MVKKALLSVLLSALLLGCGSPRTQVTIAVDTDLEVSSEIDTFQIEVVGPDSAPKMAETMAASQPSTLGLLHTQGPLGPFVATISGLKSGAVIVTRTVIFDFVKEETRLLAVTLLRKCLTAACPSGQTCAEEGCRSSNVSSTELTVWDGEAVEADAAVDANQLEDASADVIADMLAEDANTPDMRVPDARPDAEMTCGNCDSPGAITTCVEGRCVVVECMPGLGDCDGELSNGCEQRLSSRRHCGRCNNNCAPRRCVDMTCQ